MPKPFKGFGKPPQITYSQPKPHKLPPLNLPPNLPKEDVILEESCRFITYIALHDAYNLEKAAVSSHNRFGLAGLLACLGLALAQAQKEDLDWFCQQQSSVIPKQLFDPEEIDVLRKMARQPLSNTNKGYNKSGR